MASDGLRSPSTDLDVRDKYAVPPKAWLVGAFQEVIEVQEAVLAERTQELERYRAALERIKALCTRSLGRDFPPTLCEMQIHEAVIEALGVSASMDAPAPPAPAG